MLGFNSNREPVKGKVARKIREQLNRIKENSLSEKDKELQAMQQRKCKFTIVEG